MSLVPMQEREGMTEAVAAIHAASDLLLTCHINPDGDALGSMLALGLGLLAIGKRVTMVSADGVPATLEFLPAKEQVVKQTERRDFDLAIVLDAGDLSRVGPTREAVLSAPHVMDIDHHVTAGVFGDLRLLDATAAATAEIVYDLLLALNVELTQPIAVCLMTGLLTDTGSFRYRNVTPRTMALGGAFVFLGASPDSIAEAVYENKPFAAQKLLGRALESLRRTADGRVAWAHITQGDFHEFGATDEDTEGIVNAVRMVRGADVAIVLREMATGKLRVSLRARPPIDISEVAARFGGGGHRLASGCTLEGPLDQAEPILIAAVQEAVAAASPTPAASGENA